MRAILVSAAIVALVAAGCGNGGGDGAPDEGTPEGDGAETPEEDQAGADDMPVELGGPVNNEGTERLSGAEPALELEADDYYFEPTFVQAEGGATISVTVGNEGDVDHTFTIDSLGISETIAPGDSVEVQVGMPQDEALAFYCEFHDGQGMRGAFFTEEGQSVAD